MVPHKHSLHIKSQLRHKAELLVIEGAGHGVLEESKHIVRKGKEEEGKVGGKGKDNTEKGGKTK